MELEEKVKRTKRRRKGDESENEAADQPIRGVTGKANGKHEQAEGRGEMPKESLRRHRNVAPDCRHRPRVSLPPPLLLLLLHREEFRHAHALSEVVRDARFPLFCRHWLLCSQRYRLQQRTGIEHGSVLHHPSLGFSRIAELTATAMDTERSKRRPISF